MKRVWKQKNHPSTRGKKYKTTKDQFLFYPQMTPTSKRKREERSDSEASGSEASEYSAGDEAQEQEAPKNTNK